MNKYLIFLLVYFITGCSYNKINNVEHNSSYYNSKSQLNQSDRKQIEVTSKLMLNTKYTYGGKAPDFGVDCSGFVSYVLKTSINYKLIGSAKDMAKIGQKIPNSFVFNNQLEVGDLLFFNTTGQSFSHVGIYVGNDKFIHASSGQKKVILSSVHSNYFKNRLELVKRI